jgi:hypothetical protein
MQYWVRMVGGEPRIVEHGEPLGKATLDRFKRSSESFPEFIVDDAAESDQVIDRRNVALGVVVALVKNAAFWHDLKH